MNRDDFLQNLFSMYPNTFTEKNLRTWHKAYCIVFGNKKINYDKLFEIYVTSYQNTSIPPAPAWFKEHISTCAIKPDICAALKHNMEIKQEGGTPPPAHIKQKLTKLLKKVSM